MEAGLGGRRLMGPAIRPLASTPFLRRKGEKVTGQTAENPKLEIRNKAEIRRTEMAAATQGAAALVSAASISAHDGARQRWTKPSRVAAIKVSPSGAKPKPMKYWP